MPQQFSIFVYEAKELSCVFFRYPVDTKFSVAVLGEDGFWGAQ